MRKLILISLFIILAIPLLAQKREENKQTKNETKPNQEIKGNNNNQAARDVNITTTIINKNTIITKDPNPKNPIISKPKTDLANLVSGTYEVSVSHGTVDGVDATVQVEKIDNNKIRISSKGETSYELEIKQLTENKIGEGYAYWDCYIYFENYGNRTFISGYYPNGQTWQFRGSRPGRLSMPVIGK